MVGKHSPRSGDLGFYICEDISHHASLHIHIMIGFRVMERIRLILPLAGLVPSLFHASSISFHQALVKSNKWNIIKKIVYIYLKLTHKIHTTHICIFDSQLALGE